MNIAFTSNNVEKQQERKPASKAEGAVLGAVAGIGTQTIIKKAFCKPALKELQNINDTFSKQNSSSLNFNINNIKNGKLSVSDFVETINNSKVNTLAEEFKTAAGKAFDYSGLSKKGVSILDANKVDFDEFFEIMKKGASKLDNKLLSKSKLYKKITQTFLQPAYKSAKQGCNAFFISNKVNKIFLNKDKASIFAFHEMGHAVNKHFSKIGNILQKSRKLQWLSTISLGVAFLKGKKKDNEEPKGIFDKTTTFVKNNAGKLAFIGMLPTVIEEGLASINGHKLAKSVLSAENLKKLDKLNIKCWLTYVGLALGTTLGTMAASKVRDEAVNPTTKIKQENV